MDKYYYVVAQLPLLAFDRETYMTTEMFLEEAEKWLSPADYVILSQARYDATNLTTKAPRLLKQYVEWEYRFRTDLAKWRKALREGQDYKPEYFSASMMKENDPLDVEKALLKRRWAYIEEVEPDHHFDLEFLILYFFKLQILEKLSLYNKEKGLEIFQKISKVDI